MKSFFGEQAQEQRPMRPSLPVEPPVTDEIMAAQAQSARRTPVARIAVYDSLTASPRIEDVTGSDARALIEALSSRTYQLSHDAGGSLPYMVIREVVENLIHAKFSEVVVTILDGGNTIRLADQGPGISDKDRVFLPGFSTATDDMKCVIKGVGSGLPVARECLTFSGGTIVVDDNLGIGTVVTIQVDAATVEYYAAQDSLDQEVVIDVPNLSLRQKQVLSLIIEFGSVGPTIVSRELAVGLSTAYRDLAALEEFKLIESDESGKRVLTRFGVDSLDQLLNS